MGGGRGGFVGVKVRKEEKNRFSVNGKECTIFSLQMFEHLG